MAGEAATIEAGPFASLEEASRHHLGPPAWTHGEEILQQDALVRTLYSTYARAAEAGEEYHFAAITRGRTGGGVLQQPSGGSFPVLLDTPVTVTGDATRLIMPEWHREDAARIDDYVKLEIGEGLVIGRHCHLASFVHVLGGGLTVLEEGSSFGSGAKIISGSNTYGPTHGCSAIAPDATVARSFAWVKKNATLYAGAILLPGCVLGEGSVLAAGAVLKANTVVGPHELWAGNPATFKKRIG